ncbi:hypothetical protein LguiA_004059 [Lonicera macranthoides]
MTMKADALVSHMHLQNLPGKIYELLLKSFFHKYIILGWPEWYRTLQGSGLWIDSPPSLPLPPKLNQNDEKRLFLMERTSFILQLPS